MTGGARDIDVSRDSSLPLAQGIRIRLDGCIPWGVMTVSYRGKRAYSNPLTYNWTIRRPRHFGARSCPQASPGQYSHLSAKPRSDCDTGDVMFRQPLHSKGMSRYHSFRPPVAEVFGNLCPGGILVCMYTINQNPIFFFRPFTSIYIRV